jgi:hypothetical protein
MMKGVWAGSFLGLGAQNLEPSDEGAPNEHREEFTTNSW